ncbi:CHAT domain-containing protein [Lactarius vividus]|nr:CHAT domain-containing protein [Lactarius vividus]
MSVHEIDSSIAGCQQILAILPLSDPLRIPYLLFLASRKLLRYMQSNQKEDLDKSIFHWTELIRFAPYSLLEYKSLIFPAFLILANALLKRSMVSNQPEDAIFAIKYLRHLRGQPHATLGFPRHAVTTLLMHALAFMVKLKDSNVVQNIEEMTVLFHELLTSDASEHDITHCSTLLAGNYFFYSHLWTLDQPLTQVIECLRLAKMHKAAPRVVQSNLAFCLCVRYTMTNVNDDYEKAASIVDELIASSSPGDLQDERVAKVQEFVAALAMFRSMIHRDPEYSEEAMYRASAIIDTDPVGHHFRPWLNYWESIAEDRFGHFGAVEGHEARPRMSRPLPVAVHWGLLYSGAESTRRLSATLLARFLYFRSHRTDNLTQDLDEALELLSQCANDRQDNFPDRFHLACYWASLSHLTQHHSVSTAYETAVSLMQDTLLFAPTLQLQHAALAKSDTDHHRIPLDYASYQVDLRQLEEAIVTLERGRALLWSEMRHLRTPIDPLLQAHPQIAHNFAAVNRDLEELHQDGLLHSRNEYGLDSSHYDETLAFVLAELYKLVGKPVIDRLRRLKVPEQSRIWWCPTSVFCSLPLHAMGPIPSDDDGETRYFLDLYICSYTPTLSALIQSRNRDFGSRSSVRPSLLLVAQPDSSLPTVEGEIQVVQSLDTEVTSLISEAATPATVIDGFRRHPFVHFVCHGMLEAGKPFEAGFELHRGERLTLLEIVRSDLPTAEFAFLSACHTAEVTEGSIVDEGLHLAAAVQYCGFRSVVGTMWAMADEDGQDLAKHFYKTLFSAREGEQGIPYHERSAKALRFRGEEAAEEETTDDAREMGEFRSLCARRRSRRCFQCDTGWHVFKTCTSSLPSLLVSIT